MSRRCDICAFHIDVFHLHCSSHAAPIYRPYDIPCDVYASLRVCMIEPMLLLLGALRHGCLYSLVTHTVRMCTAPLCMLYKVGHQLHTRTTVSLPGFQMQIHHAHLASWTTVMALSIRGLSKAVHPFALCGVGAGSNHPLSAICNLQRVHVCEKRTWI